MFGVGLRDVIGLVRETHGAARPIIVSGPRARELADGLTRDGDGSLVRVGGEPANAAAYVVVLDGELGAAEEARLRQATRAGLPLLAVVLGELEGELPYVLPDDVIDVAEPGGALPVDQIAERLAAILGTDGVALAARLPALRDSVNRRRTLDSALGVAALAAFSGGAGRPLLPVLALTQARTLRQLSLARGESAPSAPDAIATTVAPELAASLAVGLACRTLVRRLPMRGRLVEALVAGAGTFALASAGRYLRARR
jgi:hypothetical protein